MSFPVRIASTGVYVPSERVTANDLDLRLGLPPGTALARNGVASRFFAGEGETASHMAAAAVQSALQGAGYEAPSLDAILFSGVMSEQPMPCTAILLHQRLAARREGTTCLDLNASCAGFLKGMEIASAGIASGLWSRVAVVAAELSSKGLRWEDPDTCTLFGDGAAAAILEKSSGESAILATRSVTLSEGADLCEMRAGGSRYNVRTPPPAFEDYLFTMKGRQLLRLVQEHFPPLLEELLRLSRTVDLVVPHQASAVGLAFLRKQLQSYGLAAVDILSEFGNQVSASIPFALHHAIARGQLHRGQTALLIGTAAGVTMNGVVVRY